MTNDPESEPQEADRAHSKAPAVASSQPERRLTISEWLTFLVGVGTLAVAVLTYLNALDTSDLKSAVRHLSDLANAEAALANSTAGELAAMNAQVAQLSRQADVADDTRRREFRPYVSVVANMWDKTIAPMLAIEQIGPGGPTGKLTLTTLGKSPTVDAKLRAGAFFAPKGFAGGAIPSAQIPVPANLAADGNQITLSIGSAHPDPDGFKLFNRGEMIAAMAGEVDYRDPFGKPHHTRFCYYVTRLGEEPISCRRGNSSD